jgi:hypothetical protein
MGKTFMLGRARLFSQMLEILYVWVGAVSSSAETQVNGKFF